MITKTPPINNAFIFLTNDIFFKNPNLFMAVNVSF